MIQNRDQLSYVYTSFWVSGGGREEGYLSLSDSEEREVPEGEDIQTGVELLAHSLCSHPLGLGGHVLQSSVHCGECSGCCAGVEVQETGVAEVGYLGRELGGEQDVGGSQVSMDDGRCVAVKIVQTSSYV